MKIFTLLLMILVAPALLIAAGPPLIVHPDISWTDLAKGGAVTHVTPPDPVNYGIYYYETNGTDDKVLSFTTSGYYALGVPTDADPGTVSPLLIEKNDKTSVSGASPYFAAAENANINVVDLYGTENFGVSPGHSSADIYIAGTTRTSTATSSSAALVGPYNFEYGTAKAGDNGNSNVCNVYVDIEQPKGSGDQRVWYIVNDAFVTPALAAFETTLNPPSRETNDVRLWSTVRRTMIDQLNC